MSHISYLQDPKTNHLKPLYPFNILPLSNFTGSNATIRRPQEIACFSYDDEHRYHQDDRSLRYYYPPQLGANLCKGFDTFEQLDDSVDTHLDDLLKTIIALEKETGTKCEADIITWRGMMTKIMATPYEGGNENGFEMNATNFQGTIFIEENHEYKVEQRRSQYNQRPRRGAVPQDMMSYWGYKFETLSLLPDPWDSTSREYIEGREDLVVNNYAQYCSVVRTGIGKVRMVIGGEVDAVWDCKPDDKDRPINWVELKTTAEINDDRDVARYERKLLKFWIQSFLLGVPKIVVGFRTKNGILQSLQELETRSIPGLVKRGGKNNWDGNTCINFTANFLRWLKQTITTEGVWRIRRVNGSPAIEVYKHTESGYGDIVSREFLTWRNQLDSTSPLGGAQ